ncbi:2'-5' RNA ligase superfamily-domain-containing protein [Pavlovales sp. CCMP2436]|nr:2'-5' RNA ligase superfamily-domain-containing protein [Pavlovales sp. CCMP2436]
MALGAIRAIGGAIGARGGALAAIAMAIGDRLLHTTALAIVPPEGTCWAPIQDARERLRDGGLFRWPPHINLVYPFIEPMYFERFAGAVAPALADCAPFTLRLERFGVFGGRAGGVVWLDPQSAGDVDGVVVQPLLELHELLCNAAPEIRRPPGRPFVPHLTLTHTDSEASARAIAEASGAEWATEGRYVEFEVSEILVLSRATATQPFRTAWRLPLGREGGAAPRPDPRVFESMPTASSLGWKPRTRQAPLARARAAERQKGGAESERRY